MLTARRRCDRVAMAVTITSGARRDAGRHIDEHARGEADRMSWIRSTGSSWPTACRTTTTSTT